MKLTKQEKKQVMDILEMLIEDFEMLQDEVWIPDYESCDCSIDNVNKLIEIIRGKVNESN